MILNQVWGYNIVVNPNVVDLYIGYVRKKLKCEKKEIYSNDTRQRLFND